MSHPIGTRVTLHISSHLAEQGQVKGKLALWPMGRIGLHWPDVREQRIVRLNADVFSAVSFAHCSPKSLIHAVCGKLTFYLQC